MYKHNVSENEKERKKCTPARNKNFMFVLTIFFLHICILHIEKSLNITWLSFALRQHYLFSSLTRSSSESVTERCQVSFHF